MNVEKNTSNEYKDFDKKVKTAKIFDLVGKVLVYAELIFMAFVVLYPVLWIVGSAFNPTNNISSPTPIPEGATLDNFKELIEDTKYLSWYKNTLYVATMTMIFSVLVNTLTAFIFARFEFKGRKIGLLSVMILQMFPSFLGMTALYMLALNFGLLNNLNMLVIIYVAGSIPGNIWLVQGYMLNLPRSLDEAAYMDGASKLQIYWHVILPLAIPIIAFIAVTSFMGPWMDYILPRLLINKDSSRTLAVGLFELIRGREGTKYTLFSAGALLVAVPIASLYIYFQRFLLEGLTAGANKGE